MLIGEIEVLVTKTALKFEQAVVQKHNKPHPVLRITRLELTQNVVRWSLHTFPENFMQIVPAIFS